MADSFSTDDMLDVYLFESKELLEKLQGIVLEQKDEECFSEEAINEIFRVMHTLKASASIMMYDEVTVVAHKLEDIFFVLRESHPENVSHLKLVEHVLEVADFIMNELEKVANNGSTDGDTSEIMESLDAFLKDIKGNCIIAEKKETSDKESLAQKFYIAPVANVEPSNQSVDVPIFIDLESTVEEIEERVVRTQEQIMQEAKSKVLVPGDFVIQAKETGRVKSLVNSEKPAYINVEVAKMDQLYDLIGEFNKAADQMLKISTDLQNVFMSMRMVSLTNTFQKMNRIVFDVSRKLGKDIEFVMDGETIEVDKNIVEHVSDPLMHLVRNAVDHGIETSEEKAATGKVERSRVTLSAKMEEDNILITVEDNGKGLDRDKILNKARNQGLLDGNKQESAYTDKEVFEFITLPGFSTNEEITEYSGRGVGMDVVVSNIASIGGSLEIESEKGKGSRMTMKIPFTRIRGHFNGET